MKALSIKQPWASLIIEGIKPVENRCRAWKHRGPLAIHASKDFDGFWPHWILDVPQKGKAIRRISDIIEKSKELTGGIVGSVNMVDCVTIYDSDFFLGPFGYVLEDPKKCDLIPWKGKQGVMNIPINSLPNISILDHFPGSCDCYGCGNLLDTQPENLECPNCGQCLLPF